MHNGHLANFNRIKRKLASSIKDEYFLMIQGSTDSEWAFALFLDTLESLGVDPKNPPTENGFGHALLREAMLGLIRRLNEMWTDTETDEPSLLNFAATDGHSVVCTRYVSSQTDEAASLYFSSGTRFHEYKEGGFYRMERHDRGQDLVMVASEPLTFERGDWVTVPTNSILSINKQTVLIHPIIGITFPPLLLPSSNINLPVLYRPVLSSQSLLHALYCLRRIEGHGRARSRNCVELRYCGCRHCRRPYRPHQHGHNRQYPTHTIIRRLGAREVGDYPNTDTNTSGRNLFLVSCNVRWG